MLIITLDESEPKLVPCQAGTRRASTCILIIFLPDDLSPRSGSPGGSLPSCCQAHCKRREQSLRCTLRVCGA